MYPRVTRLACPCPCFGFGAQVFSALLAQPLIIFLVSSTAIMPRVLLPLLAFGAVTSHALAPPPSAVARAWPSRQRGALPTAQEAVAPLALAVAGGRSVRCTNIMLLRLVGASTAIFS